jgi:hypothetical protein
VDSVTQRVRDVPLRRIPKVVPYPGFGSEGRWYGVKLIDDISKWCCRLYFGGMTAEVVGRSVVFNLLPVILRFIRLLQNLSRYRAGPSEINKCKGLADGSSRRASWGCLANGF